MKKEKHLRIRITESQFTRLVDNIFLTKEKSKSEFVRQAIIEKIERTNTNVSNKIKKNNT
jgi:hypothetical protein